MPGQQLIMTFPVTATSHTLADYRARGGYEALKKALTMAPQDITKEVTASGLLGHGGAAFPVGRKWAVVKLNDNQPHFLCANADEGEPGTFKDRWILEHAPHLLLESMLIACRALQVRNCFVYIRGEFDLPYRRLAAAVEEAYEAGYFGERDSRHRRFRLRHRDHPRRGLVRLRRGLRTALLGRGQARVPAQPAAAPHRQGALPAADGRQQRRDAVQRRRDRHAWAPRRSRRSAWPKCPGTQLVSISGHINKPGVYEVEYGYPLQKFLFDDCGGILGGQKLKCIIPGGISTKVLTAAEMRVAHLRQGVAGRGGLAAGLRRHDRHRRRTRAWCACCR